MRKFWLRGSMGLIGCAVAAAPASAQNVAAPNTPSSSDQITREAERIQEREAERQRAREQEFRDAQTTPPSGAEVKPAETIDMKGAQCVALQSVSVTGLTIYKRDVFAKELNSLIGPCTGIDAINNVLRAITNRYIIDGFVTSRAIVGPQDLQDGSLEIAVFEGMLTKIKTETNGFSARTLDMAFPELEGRILNLRALEQGVDQLSRLPSVEPNIDIVPGTDQGSSDVLVTRKIVGPRFRPNITFSNDGSLSTGRIQTNIGEDFDNILGLADYWSIYATRAVENDAFKGSRGFGGFVSMPYGFWTVSLSGGRFQYESVLQGNGQSFLSTGRSWNGSAIVDRMLYRDAKTKISVSATLAASDSENRIQGIRLSTSSYRLVTGAVDWRVQHRLGKGLLSGGLGLTRGLSVLGANAADTGPGGPRLQFRVMDASFGYQQQIDMLGVPTNYSGTVRAQTSLDPVFSSNRFSLGGSSTVRGFRDDGISGRHGAFVRQQIEFPTLALLGKKEKLQFITTFVGYDAGGIVSRDNDRFERGFLQSSTLGIRLRNKNFQAELSASAPLSGPSFVDRKRVELAASLRLSL
jgi:hemolysin activation/secretion protein